MKSWPLEILGNAAENNRLKLAKYIKYYLSLTSKVMSALVALLIYLLF